MDFMALLAEYVKPELLIIAVALYALGMFLKGAPNIADWIIPFVLLAAGIILAILHLAIMMDMGFAPKSIFEGFIQGIICSALAVFTNQLIKQAKEKD